MEQQSRLQAEDVNISPWRAAWPFWCFLVLVVLLLVPLFIDVIPQRDAAFRYAPMADAFREGDFTFLHGVHFAGELHVGEILAELAVRFAGQELLEETDVLAAEAGDHLQRFADAADHRPVVVVGRLAEEKVEHGDLVFHTVVVERLAHRVLVFVGTI